MTDYYNLDKAEFIFTSFGYIFGFITLLLLTFSLASPFWWFANDREIWNGSLYMCWESHGSTEGSSASSSIACSLYSSSCGYDNNSNFLFDNQTDCNTFLIFQRLLISGISFTFVYLIISGFFTFGCGLRCINRIRRRFLRNSVNYYFNFKVALLCLFSIGSMGLVIGSIVVFHSVVNTDWYEGRSPDYGPAYYVGFAAIASTLISISCWFAASYLERKLMLVQEDQRRQLLLLNAL